jgi:hypothetical protein
VPAGSLSLASSDSLCFCVKNVVEYVVLNLKKVATQGKEKSMAKKRAAQPAVPKRNTDKKASASAARQDTKAKVPLDPPAVAGNAKGETSKAKTAGRPVGRPKGEASVIINVRLPVSLLERFNRYLDRREQGTWEVVNRGMVIRELLEDMLESEGL